MQKRLKTSVSLLLIVLLAFGAVGCAAQTAAGTSIVSIKTAVAVKQKIKTTMDVTGVLVPAQMANVVSKLSGQVTSMGYEVGSSVKAGSTLIKMETKTLNAQLLVAQAGLQTAMVSTQTVIGQAEQVKINLDKAQKDYDDSKALYDSGAAPKSDLDALATKLEIAKKQYEMAIGASQAQAQAAIDTANANINSIRVQLENAVIKSPISGIVTNKNINVGELASAGVTLLTIADTSTLKLKGTVPQEVIPFLQIGQEINVSIDIYPDKVFKGKIENLGPIAVSTGVFFPIEISIENTGDLKAGLSAHAAIDIEEAKGVVVPSSAVVQKNGESYVFVVKDNVASKRSVIIGLKNDKEVEILKGLTEGETIAVTNVNNIFDNMSVNVN